MNTYLYKYWKPWIGSWTATKYRCLAKLVKFQPQRSTENDAVSTSLLFETRLPKNDEKLNNYSILNVFFLTQIAPNAGHTLKDSCGFY